MRRRHAVTPVLAVLAACLVPATASAGENPAFRDYQAFLAANPLGIMTTVEDGRPRTRAFQFLWVDNGRVYFSTGAGKDVAKQMRANPNVSFCTRNPEFNVVLSVDGKVSFSSDAGLKKRALDEYPALKDIYKSADNPEFTLIFIEPDQIYTFSFVAGKQYIKK
ncbi:MAG: pyridoxamine 5'-phosphate oxidase family protein [Planctomycetota bacterium]|jgi:uncharacterized pyridoxamine 5'-phosphate oxidase family protein|nr:pyridoxamine 5'-phosphate oxidase family protein [Planctomycetota bacterium]